MLTYVIVPDFWIFVLPTSPFLPNKHDYCLSEDLYFPYMYMQLQVYSELSK